LLFLKTGVYTPDQFLAEEQRLQKELSTIIAQRSTIENNNFDESFKNIKKLSELLKDLCLYDFYANPFEKDKIAQIVFSELFYSDKTLKYKCKNGFEALESRFVSSCAQNDWLSEVPCHSDEINQGIKKIEEYIGGNLPRKLITPYRMYS
jgi:hypothetical protein